MSNPAPYFVEEKVIAVIDNKRIESYSPTFVKVVDMNRHGDVETTVYNSMVLPLSDFAGHPVIDAYIEEMNEVQRAYAEKMEAVYAKNGIVTYEARRKAREAKAARLATVK